MTNTLSIALNGSLSVLAILAVSGLVALAHRLPRSAPHHDALWGNGGNPWVSSDPLPLAQVSAHEHERVLTHAA